MDFAAKLVVWLRNPSNPRWISLSDDYYHIVLITEEASRALAFAAFLLSCLGIIAGGAYHSHCAYLGLLILLILLVTGKTALPPWMAALSPGVLFLLRPLTRKLPRGLHMILSGGFTNIIFIVYYLAALLVSCCASALINP